MTSEGARYQIRPGRKSDVTGLAGLHAAVQLQSGTGGHPHPGIAAWVEDLMDGHPSVTPADFLVAEDRTTGRPAASLVGIRQTWSLAGVPLPVAQVELVGTAPEHRGNRLADRLFDAFHQHGAEDGTALQMIEGIPYFYRRLGYDYALANDGAPTVPAGALASAVTSQGGEPIVRSATTGDAEALAAVDRRIMGGAALNCPRDAAVWRYEIGGRSPEDIAGRKVAVLVRDAEVRGYLVHGDRLSPAGELPVLAAACAQPADWPHAAPAMHAYLGETGRGLTGFTAVRRILSPAHPLVRFGPAGVPRRPRGWYVRCADPIALLARLQPLLRARWRTADLRWPEPEMIIDLYGRAARLEFADGELTTVTAVRGVVSPSTDPATHAAVPPEALIHLMLGHRTLPEVLDLWPDCLPRDRRAELFLTAAFPAVPVHVWPQG
jgi:ribosomal protein S18 acetylase RimI-like enzyme